MIIKNKLTKEKIEVTTSEFRTRFAKEYEDALESYKRTVMAKPSYKIFNASDIEVEFVFDLQWNFNHYTNSNWYIESLSK